MILGLIERHSVEGYDYKIKKLKSLPVLSYFTFCNVLYMGVSGPSLLIESTDSMIIIL